MGVTVGVAARRTRIALAIAYSIVLAAVVLWPEPVDAGLHDEIARWIWRINRLGVDRIDYADIESISNVLLFVPLGIVVATLVRRGSEWIAVLAGVLASAAAEAAQWLLLPERFATLGDVLANGTGAAVGALAVAAMRALARRQARLRYGRDVD